MTIGTKYTTSGKFEFSKVIVATLIGIVVAALIGILYAFISEINPFIYLNVIVLAVIYFLLWELVKKISKTGKSRNMIVNISVGLILGIVAIYSAWCYYVAKNTNLDFFTALMQPASVIDFVSFFAENQVFSIGKVTSSSRIDVSGVFVYLSYGIELLAFLAPAIAGRKPMYYNEELKLFYDETEYFSVMDDKLLENFDKAFDGKYPFLSEQKFYENILELPTLIGDKALKLQLRHLQSAPDHGILTVQYGILKGKDHDDRKISKLKTIVQDLYIDGATLKGILKD